MTRDRVESATWGRLLHVYWPKPVKLTPDIPNPTVDVLDDLTMKNRVMELAYYRLCISLLWWLEMYVGLI